jgi:general stress protein 26
VTINDKEWRNILKFYGSYTHATASPTLPYCAFSTVNEDGTPRIAPYTSLVLGDSSKGFYFDELSRHTSANLERDQRVCVLVVKNSKWFWIKTVIL